MAFDQPTRNRLQRFVGDARGLLAEEFTRQLQKEYGLDPETGTVTPLAQLSHLDDARLDIARVLREILEHYVAVSGDAEDRRREELDRLVREQAFTVLNRLCAIRMAESRGLLIESVGQGSNSKGFQLYARLAGTGLGESGDAYRSYLLSVFDELALDLPHLFDRFSSQGLLFPRETALLALLKLINAPDIDPLWGEDETIGWIYQYFNPKDERKKMREESAAPRNSRELAVRNQFFTPRYVVEFLTDNTLGRIWYEMTQGRTRLKDECCYMIRRLDEVFLGASTNPSSERADQPCVEMAEQLCIVKEAEFPEFDATEVGIHRMIVFAHCTDAYARRGDEELWPWFGRAREQLRAQHYEGVSSQDIWDVLFLTCRSDRHGGDGSVYLEPWFAAACNELRRRLLAARKQDASSNELLRMPVLVRHRAGKDPRDLRMLDPACGSMHFGLYAFDLFATIYEEAWDVGGLRTPEGMQPLREAYANKEDYLRDVPRLILEHNIHGIDIDPRAVQIASLALWLRAQRAWHEAGVSGKERPLIRRSNILAAVAPPAERHLREQLVAKLDGRDAELFEGALVLLKGLPELGVLLRMEEELPHLIRRVHGAHGPMFKEEDQASWEKAEERLRNALTEFVHAAQATYQGRLFAQDALEGLRLIDLVRESFDVVVMNPPFGALSLGVKAALAKAYPRSKNDLLAIFVERGLELLRAGGRIGAITSRSCFFLSSFQRWREEVVLGTGRPEVMADLGHGVMDDAMVEAAAYVLEKQA